MNINCCFSESWHKYTSYLSVYGEITSWKNLPCIQAFLGHVGWKLYVLVYVRVCVKRIEFLFWNNLRYFRSQFIVPLNLFFLFFGELYKNIESLDWWLRYRSNNVDCFVQWMSKAWWKAFLTRKQLVAGLNPTTYLPWLKLPRQYSMMRLMLRQLQQSNRLQMAQFRYHTIFHLNRRHTFADHIRNSNKICFIILASTVHCFLVDSLVAVRFYDVVANICDANLDGES